jgi:OmpA-OmpF porin, OOP family
MKDRRIPLFVAALALVPGAAPAQNLSTTLRVGGVQTPDVTTGRVGFEDPLAFKTGFSLGAAIGYTFASGLRTDAELGYVRADVDNDGGVATSGSFRHYLLMANAYYDFAPAATFKPYAGAGLGYARAHEMVQAFADGPRQFFRRDEKRDAFAYQARVGIACDLLGPRTSLGYRFLRVRGGETMPNAFPVRTDDLTQHSIELGVTF